MGACSEEILAMKQALRLCTALAIVLSLMSPSALAQNEQLQVAKELFEAQNYVAAQVALLEVDADGLTDEEQATYDFLLKALPEAIAGAKQAEQDMIDADEAYDEGRWEDADQLYTRVMENSFTSQGLRDQAKTQRQRIAEKLELSEAAMPDGPVEGQSEAARPETPKPPAPENVQPVAPLPAPEPARKTLLDEMRARDELLWQRAEAKMKEFAQKAGEAVAAERFEEARMLAESALQVVEANRAYAQPPARYEAARTVALELKQSVNSAYLTYSENEAERQRADIAAQMRQRQAEQDRQRQEKVEQLFNTARQLRKEQRFREASEAVRQILVIDSSNADARLWLDFYEDSASLYEQKDVQREIERQTQYILQQADESRIPWHNDILYPRNWLEISARREGITGSIGSDEDFELNRALESVQPDANFDEMPFDQAIDFVTELNQLNVAVDWHDLEQNAIDRDRPISLRLRDVTVRTLLREMLNQVGGDTPLGFAVGEGLVRVATKAKLDRRKHTLVYDIRDLIVDIPRFANAPLMDFAPQGPSGIDARHLSGNHGSLFGTHGGASGLEGGSAFRNSNQLVVSEILDIIRETVEPDSWRETGGGDGALRELNGQLIVYNTSDAHQQTRALLSQLREARALMIGVEARFLVVGSNFLEEMGVDIDFVFNTANAGFDPAFTTGTTGGVAPITDPFTGAQVLVPRAYSQTGVLPAIPGLGGGPFNAQSTPLQPYGHPGFVPGSGGGWPSSSYMSPVTAQQSSLNLADPRALNTGIPGTFAREGLAPALNIAGSFLDNLQVDFLIRATQANRRSSVVQAPRLMMFNGQRAWVAIVRNRQYVSSVTPSVAEGAVGVQPVQQNAASGSSLDVEGTISADRKYVTITVRTGQAGEPSFERFEVQRASGNSPGIFVLLPDQERTGIRTTVSVPDGGTVLLGGLKQVGEVEIDAGVPILSKIPILKRAFTNTTRVKDTQTLLILLKAKILIQNEAEQEAFPTLSSMQPG